MENFQVLLLLISLPGRAAVPTTSCAFIDQRTVLCQNGHHLCTSLPRRSRIEEILLDGSFNADADVSCIARAFPRLKRLTCIDIESCVGEIPSATMKDCPCVKKEPTLIDSLVSLARNPNVRTMAGEAWKILTNTTVSVPTPGPTEGPTMIPAQNSGLRWEFPNSLFWFMAGLLVLLILKGGYEFHRALVALFIVYRGCHLLSAKLSDEAPHAPVDAPSTPMPSAESVDMGQKIRNEDEDFPSFDFAGLPSIHQQMTGIPRSLCFNDSGFSSTPLRPC